MVSCPIQLLSKQSRAEAFYWGGRCYYRWLGSFRQGCIFKETSFEFEAKLYFIIFLNISLWTRQETEGDWGLGGQKGTRKGKKGGKEIVGWLKKHTGGGRITNKERQQAAEGLLSWHSHWWECQLRCSSKGQGLSTDTPIHTLKYYKHVGCRNLHAHIDTYTKHGSAHTHINICIQANSSSKSFLHTYKYPVCARMSRLWWVFIYYCGGRCRGT